MTPNPDSSTTNPTFAEAIRVWVRVAAASFGGPAGQIAVIHRTVVEERRWISEQNFVHALSYCMLLPGPEAQQLATYLGWRLHGTRGGLTAGLLFIAPGFLSILLLSILYYSHQQSELLAGVFFGLKAAVLPIVLHAVPRLARRTGGRPLGWTITALSFVAIFAFQIPFPLILLVAAVTGFLLYQRSEPVAADQPVADVPHVAFGRVFRVVALWLAVWWIPVLALTAWVGREHVFIREAVFFSQTAVVTFGGAYAVLSYVAQQAVETFGWLSPGEMLDGLGMAETTPGPLIMVLQFVGFLGAARNPGSFNPITAGVIGSVVTAWVTFAPCFLFIFAGAPFVERLLHHRGLSAAMRGISAAVVGVVLNLAVWFALHTLFSDVTTLPLGPAALPWPEWGSFSPGSAIVTVAAGIALIGFRRGLFATLCGGALLGALLYLAGVR